MQPLELTLCWEQKKTVANHSYVVQTSTCIQTKLTTTTTTSYMLLAKIQMQHIEQAQYLETIIDYLASIHLTKQATTSPSALLLHL